VENVLKASAKFTYPISCLSLAAALVVQQCVSASAAATMAVKALTGVVYALVGLPTFMGVCHSIAALNINTHVLTMVAVACLLPLGHAMEVRIPRMTGISPPPNTYPHTHTHTHTHKMTEIDSGIHAHT
jgi:hypothetical protein